MENCAVLLRELRAQGYAGSASTLRAYVHPLRRGRAPQAARRFETRPGEQAQVDWGEFRYRTAAGGTHRVWAFVMVLSWSRAMYVEFVDRADTATFMRCHLNAFAHFGGVSECCLFDNTKLVVIHRGTDGEVGYNERFLDFSLRLGFRIALCPPYSAKTKGRVESGIKYLRHNFWPSVRFSDMLDLNRQVQAWLQTVADVRVHGTTTERPVDRLEEERLLLRALPGAERLQPFLREERRVGRDGYLRWEGAAYGVAWPWAGQVVQVQPDGDTVSIWAGDRLLIVHPRATRRGQHLRAPDQWDGLPRGGAQPQPEPLAVQVPTVEVERRSLAVYDRAAGGC